MTTVSSRSQWLRLLMESMAVILSILLAFSIDAWWDGRQLRAREGHLLAGLLDDFRSSRPGLEGRLDLARRMAEGNGLLLEALERHEGGSALSVPDSLILAVLGGPTYEPATNALDAAVASGEIDLIANPLLRKELATWRRSLSDTSEDEREVRRITNEQVVPLLSRSMDLKTYFEALLPWSGGDPEGAGRLIREARPISEDHRASLAVSTELVGALALRRFFVQFAAADLEDLLATLDRLAMLLEEEMEPA